MSKKILVVAAHPDDELIGPGASLVRHVEEGDEVHALILGEGQTSRIEVAAADQADREKILSDLHSDTLRAARIIGISQVQFADFPDNSFDTVALLKITQRVESLIEDLEPDIIYTHHGGDLNIDHQLTCRAVMTASRTMENCPVREIYTFPTLSSTEWNFSYGDEAFTPDSFVEISRSMLDRKLEAMACYKSELRDWPHPRSLEMLEVQARYWGSISGFGLAECFSLMRSLKPL